MATYEDAVKKYPDWAWAFNIPGVGDELKRGLDDPNYDPMPAILRSNWYLTTQASLRQWQALQQKDPESANAELRQEESRIWDLRSKMGMAPDANWVQNAALKSKEYGWTDSQLNDYLVSQLNYNPQVSQAPGTISSTMASLKSAAANYYITLSDDTAFNYAKSVMAGEHSADDWKGIWAQQAKQQFSYSPELTKAIDNGITPDQYFAPVKDRIAAGLEVNPATINLMDSKWSKVLDTVDDKGNHRPMTYGEVDQFVRSQDDWKKTRQGQQAAADLGQTILTTFGKVAS